MSTLQELFNKAKGVQETSLWELCAAAGYTEDKRYQVGQISEKTGLLKTTTGWVLPPHGMKHSEGVTAPAGGAPNISLYTEEQTAAMRAAGNDPRFKQQRSSKDNQPIKLDHPIRFKKDTPLENEENWFIPAGEHLENSTSIARGKGIDEIDILIDNVKLPDGKTTKPDDWEKFAGNTVAKSKTTQKKRRLHVHGYRCKGLGKVKTKRVAWLRGKNGRK